MPVTTADSKRRNAMAVQRLVARSRVNNAPGKKWVNIIVRREDGTLPNSAHLNNQRRLAYEMGIPEEDDSEVSPSNDNVRHSCHLMAKLRARHDWETDRDAKRRLQAGHGEFITQRQQRAAARREAAILRYEMTIPRRRVVGHLSHPIRAQADATLSVPSEGAADALVMQGCGGWLLHNPHRQQLLRGEPVMTRIMHGEFYAPRPATSGEKKFCAAGRRHVRVASDVNRLIRTSRRA